MKKLETTRSKALTEFFNADTNTYEFRKIATSMHIAAIIDMTLKNRNISQKESAKRLNAPPPQINLWLSGTHNFTINTLLKIEIALNTQIFNLKSID